MTSLVMRCCQGGAQLIDWHVRIAWVTQRHSHFQRVESNLGLTPTVSFYLQTTYFEGIDMLFHKNMVVTTMTPPIFSGNKILHLITNLGLKKVTEIGASDINDLICKAHGWKKRSIFWDLPYWSTLLIRHNLDVMHIEKNVFEKMFNTVMNVSDKTKDTSKSIQELNEYCRRPELEKAEGMIKYPKACYTLDKIGKQVLCEWVKI